ncbi:MAG TPA: hypothetical protein VIL85_15975 [Thermomicrobiales bacterium]
MATRRGLLIGALLCGGILGGTLLWPDAAAAASTTPSNVIQTRSGDGRDAPRLRLGLVGLLGLALVGGAVVQYRSSDNAPPYQPKPRKPKVPKVVVAPTVTVATAPAAAFPTPTPYLSSSLPTPVPPTVVQWRASTPAPTTLESYRRQRDGVTSPSAREAPVLSPAEEACARAVAAAHRYDRHSAVENFTTALTLDPTVKPSVVANFWEMPAGGHADLAQAYIERGQRVDARSVVTMALMTFPHNRELAILLHELNADRFERTA